MGKRVLLTIVMLSVLLVSACTQAPRGPVYCSKDSDCVMETHYEGHCCSDKCASHPVNVDTQLARAAWRESNCDWSYLANGSLDTQAEYERWTYCLTNVECQPSVREAYCIENECKSR